MHFRFENLFVHGIPNAIAVVVNFIVSIYIIYKIIKKKKRNQIYPQYIVNHPVANRIPTISQQVNDDIVVEDIENQELNEQQMNNNNDEIIDNIEDPQIVQHPKISTRIKRINSAPNMFYKVTVENSKFSCLRVNLESSTIDILSAILKINLMSLCTFAMFVSNHFLILYLYLMDYEDCSYSAKNLKLGFAVFAAISVTAYPFLMKRKLKAFHNINH